MLGKRLCVRVGIELGRCDGFGDGLIVGFFVGDAVGGEVGGLEGFANGDPEVDILGVYDGFVVGASDANKLIAPPGRFHFCDPVAPPHLPLPVGFYYLEAFS